MKKMVALFMGLFLASVSQAVLIDDFDSYDINTSTNLMDLGSPWVVRASSDQVDVVDDGTGNQVLTYTGNGASYNLANPVANTSTATTLFLRVYVHQETIDHAFGLRDTAANNWFADYEVQMGVIANNNTGATTTDGQVHFIVRNSSTIARPALININQWYNVWAVIDQTTDTYDVYLNTGTAGATAGDLIADNYAFRNGTTDPLNAFLVLSNNTGEGVYLDDIYLTQGADLNYPLIKPYGPSVEQTANGTTIDVTLRWKAGRDPQGVYPVNPNILNEYVFIGKDNSSDPNIYCKGSVGDPGTTDPDSEYAFTADFDSSYSWVIVEKLPNMTQAISVGDPLSSLVDPNAVVGPTWKFNTLLSSASITTQPADARAFTTDASVSFTTGYTSMVNPVTLVEWYKDGDKLSVGGDISITFTDTVGEGQSTLTIATPTLADEGSYYCIVSTDSNPAATTDDSQSATRLLVIKQLLARYTFDNVADPLEDTGDLAAEVGVSRDAALVKTVSLETPDEATATVVTPNILVSGGIQGNALYLDGDEYVDLDSTGYPCAGPLNTLGDIRGSGYEKQGFGRGMDEGSILCWVKLESDGVVTSNGSNVDGTHYAVTTGGVNTARIIVRGNNWDSGWQNLGEATGAYDYMTGFDLQNGQWDMFAATWDNSTARIYINGEQVATNTQGYAEVYTAWDFSNLIGASRQGQPNRNLLNAADFITGAIDELRVYNYAVPAAEIVAEYAAMNELGVTPCLNHSFVGSNVNLDNTAGSYCVVDIMDFAVMASNWLSDGYDAQ